MPHLQFLQALNPHPHYPQDGIPVLAPHVLLPPLPSLGLDLYHHRSTVHADYSGPTLKEPLVYIVRLPGPLAIVGLRRADPGFEGVVARAEQRGAVEPQHVAGGDAVHVEGEAEDVAFGEQVGEAVNVGGDVVWFLGGQVGEELLDGSGKDKGFGGGAEGEG